MAANILLHVHCANRKCVLPNTYLHVTVCSCYLNKCFCGATATNRIHINLLTDWCSNTVGNRPAKMTNTAQVLIFFCLTLVSLSLSERVHFDQCPRNIQPKQGLDMSKLEGSWIMYAKYGHTLKGEIARCSRVEFGKEDRGEIHMFEEHIYSRWKTTKEIKLVYETEGKYDMETLSKKDFEMSFEEKQIREYYRKQRKISTFYILDTDYECWVITYRCKEKKETPQIKYSVISSALLLKNTNDCVKEQTKSNYESVLNQVGVQAPHLTWLRVHGC